MSSLEIYEFLVHTSMVNLIRDAVDQQISTTSVSIPVFGTYTMLPTISGISDKIKRYLTGVQNSEVREVNAW